MTEIPSSDTHHKSSSAASWHELAGRVLSGEQPTHAEGLAILRADDADLLDLLAAAYRVRRARHGNRVHLNLLINAKSGQCGEDCGYCSQSRVSEADVSRYDLIRPEQLLDGAQAAAECGAGTYCIVLSGLRPNRRELDTLTRAVVRIKARFPLRVCVSPGLLTEDQAAELKQCGVDRVNHNLNTSRRFYPTICTTHAYQDRLDTLGAVRRAGLEICSGGIVGMGEQHEDVVELALELGRLAAEAVPVNFFLPIPGTPLENAGRLDPRYCLKVLSLFRLANPKCELRIAAGRELHLGPLQPLGLFPADSIFVGDYLTTKGQPPEEDSRMIRALGFDPVVEGA